MHYNHDLNNYTILFAVFMIQILILIGNSEFYGLCLKEQVEVHFTCW